MFDTPLDRFINRMPRMSMKSMNLGAGEEKTIHDWDRLYMLYDGFYILDPDGFDRKDPEFDTRTYTEEDFVARRAACTLAYAGEKET